MKTLIVEDENLNRDQLVEIFAEFGPSQGVGNGFAALDAFVDAHKDENPFDLICLDIMMPDLDGQATLKEIREIETDRQVDPDKMVKVMMVTGLSDKKNIEEAFMKGSCQAYLTKPFTTQELKEQLREIKLLPA